MKSAIQSIIVGGVKKSNKTQNGYQ